jgi:hypothetical protein
VDTNEGRKEAVEDRRLIKVGSGPADAGKAELDLPADGVGHQSIVMKYIQECRTW